MEEIRAIGEKYGQWVIETRRKFHQIPELSFQEHETSQAILEELATMGIQGRIVADTGIVAEIGPAGGKRIALRADIDALGVIEETGAPFASRHPGRMHACGHDAHIAMLLGAARILKDLEPQLPGQVRLIFEPAEEIAKGARKMIAAGCMEGVDSVFGVHIWSDVPAGRISVEAGPRMASADFFTIDLDGKSCHGSRPDQGIDVVTAGAALVMALQTVVSRELSPLEPVVLSLGEFIAEGQSNVVAGHAHLSGTTRTFSNEIQDRFEGIMNRIIQHICEAFRVTGTLNYDYGSAPVINAPLGSAIAEGAVSRIMGKNALYRYEKTTSGEDFSEYLRLAPGAFAFLGTGNPDCGAVHPQHSCLYTIDESVLINGSMVEAQYAVDFLTGTYQNNETGGQNA